MEFDIELSVADLRQDGLPALVEKLPKGYCVEDGVRRGYGLLVRETTESTVDDVNRYLANFLSPLRLLAHSVRGNGAVLRVAVFSTSVTTTVVLNSESIQLLRDFDAGVEISVYPTKEDLE